MRRLTIAYTVLEEEYKEELDRLLKSSSEYIDGYSNAIREAVLLLESDNYEGCINSIAKIRDNLASTDYRLHDAMNLVSGYVQVTQEEPVVQGEPEEDSGFKEKFSKLKESVDSIGLQLSDADMKKMLEQVDNDTAS
jgi:hypothetical protein|tara:strand:+ start:2389 stop:2799 length:411 start_codon:yes stop_codon:yes gene_type:complete